MLEPDNTLSFSDKAKEALHLMQDTGKNIFLTGKAGTGKSTLLEFFRAETSKRCAVVAPTGVAAINVQGETIHAFFGLKPGFEIDEAPLAAIKCSNKKLYQNLEAIVIDEISMVRADLLDAIDIFLRLVRDVAKPFGGVQMIFIGDLYQLPPVVGRDDKEVFYSRYETSFFFGAKVFEDPDFDMEYVELDKIYRQSDDKFIDILNAIRNKTTTQEHMQVLNQRVDKQFNPKDDKYIYLMTTNSDANRVNLLELDKLPASELYFSAQTTGEVESNHFVTEQELILKEGAQIMFVNNDSVRRWVNGTIGTIIGIDEFDEELLVDIDGEEVVVTPHTWDISKYVYKKSKLEREQIGTITQFPVKLAWAITIHKSQGKTFDKVIVDLGRGSFAHGQTYVALSRCRTLEGTVLKKPVRPQDIRLDYKVQQFITSFQYSKANKLQSLEEKVELINEAIASETPLEILYLTSSNQKSTRVIYPQIIQESVFNGCSFTGLQAHCTLRNAGRTFKLERMLEVRLKD
jgi:ATP-dependent DNA helicase PIF1